MRSLDSSNDETMSGDTAMAVAVKTAGTADTAATGETAAGDDTTTTPEGSAAADLVGKTLDGKYLVSRKVGQGGMGAVYESTHTGIGKRVAIKVLLEKYAQREKIVERLRLEANLASSVGNEHIIDIVDIGTTSDGRTFIVMEFLDGESLAECLTREHTLPEKRILSIVSQAASALAAAHHKGVVHRDIKPENLFLLRRKGADFIKIVDFGISKNLRTSSDEEEATRLTQTGMVLGTPLYMSPEQARGDDQLDHRVDVYALGVIMYEAASGRVPFVGSNYLSVISQVLNEEPPPLRGQRPDLSEEFEAVVMRAMAKDVKDRYPDATAMLADVNALLEDPTHSTERAKITGPRKRIAGRSSSRYLVWIAGVAVVIAAVVVSVTQLLGGSSTRNAAAGSGSAIVVMPPPVDAAVAVVIDAPAAVVEPEAEYVSIEFRSTPEGADVLLDGLPKGTTPVTVKVFKRAKEIEGWIQLDGYNAYKFNLNPMDFEEGQVLDIPPLKKPAKGRPAVRPTHKVDPKRGSAAPPVDKSGGDLSGNPFGAGGNVRPK